MIGGKFAHVFAQLGLSVHDISVSALAAAVIVLGVVLLMELRSVLRLRHVVDNQLGRVFEQLDLLRFETQQLLEWQQSARPLEPSATAMPTPAERAVRSAESAQIVQGAENAAASLPTLAPAALVPAAVVRTSGEARLLSSLAQARARRAQAAGA